MADIPHSPYGYWISPEGDIFGLETLMGHKDWIAESGRFEREDSSESMEEAILDGWIGVSISPVGASAGIRVRRGAAEKKAARALGGVLKADGLWDVELHTDFAAWPTGRELYNRLVRTGCDTDRFASRADEIESIEAEIAERAADAAKTSAIRRALEDGSRPDFDRIATLVDEVREICRKAYDHIDRISPIGRGVGSIDELREYCRSQISVFRAFSADLARPLSLLPLAFAGIDERNVEKIEHGADEVQKHDLPEIVIEQLKVIELALGKHDGLASLRASFKCLSNELGEAYEIVERLKVSCGTLIERKLESLEKELSSDAATPTSIAAAASFYIGHECTRTFSVCGTYYTRDLKEKLAEAALSLGSVPTCR